MKPQLTTHNSQLTTHNSQLTLIALFTMLLFSSLAWGQTIIDNTYFAANLQTYIWDIAGSPYEITEDIEIPFGSNLIIEPGVEVMFQGHYYMDVKGSINAIGNSTDRITITSVAEPWNGIRFDFSDGTQPTQSKLHYCDISNAQKYGTTCTSPDPESSGGAIYVRSFSDLEIINCNIFENNVLAQGGAIVLYENSNPKIEKCSIYDNYAHKKGGGIGIINGCNPIIKGNNFYSNESDKAGGAIFIGYFQNTPCVPNISGNTIYDNHTNGIYDPTSGTINHGAGGAISICGSYPIMKNNTFEGNEAYSHGGAIHCKSTPVFSIEDCSFINNYASKNGGGVYLKNSDVSINSWFNGNNAINGGAVYVDNSTADITYSGFIYNTASTDGGAIYTLTSVSNIENCTFENNTATGNGGGVFMKDPNEGINTPLSYINLSRFKSNTAYQGSALYLNRTSNYTTNSTKVLNNLFIENHATDRGVVYMQGNNNNTIFNHNTVTNNTAATWISGVCIDYNNNIPNELKNNIIYESVVDIVIVSGQYASQHPSTYSTLAGLNYLNYNNQLFFQNFYNL